MSAAADGWIARWTVILRCEDCREAYEIDKACLNVSLEQTSPFTRLLLTPVPEGCPRCHNIKLAPAPEAKG